MKHPFQKNFILLAAAALIIVGAFLVSGYENRLTESQKSQENDFQQNNQNGLTVATSTMQNTPIAYQGNWQKALSTAFGTSSVWTNGATGVIGGGSVSADSRASSTLTPTDIFGQDLFSKYTQYQQAGVDLTDPQTQQQLIGQVMADGTYLPTPKTYDKSVLKINLDDSAASITTYSSNLATILEKDLGARQQDELTIVQNSLNSNDPSILKQLDPIIASYTLLLNDLLVMHVPSSMAYMHLNLINALNEILFADQGFTKTFSDGLTSIQGLAEYKKGVTDLIGAFTAIVHYFHDNNIPFSYQQQ